MSGSAAMRLQEHPAPRPRVKGVPATTMGQIARRCVADALGLETSLIAMDSRGPRQEAVARQLALHLVHIVGGLNHDQAARLFGRNRSTATHHFEAVEDLRDIPAFEAFMQTLEQRYALMLEIAALPGASASWRIALHQMADLVAERRLEPELKLRCEYILATFRSLANGR